MIDPSELLPLTRRALTAAETLVERARQAVLKATDGGKAEALDREQFAAHRLAWYATYVAGLRQLLGSAARLETSGPLVDIQRLVLPADVDIDELHFAELLDVVDRAFEQI